MGLFSQIKKSVNSILPSLYEDTDLSTLITWKKFKSTTFDEVKGYNVELYDSFSIRTIKIAEFSKSVSASKYPPSAMAVGVGASGYIFKFGDLPTDASTRDLLIDGTTTFRVDKITPIYGLITKVEVKGYA